VFGGPISVIVATIVLAEILVKRQRLALPAFCLTLFFSFAGFFMAHSFVEPLSGAQITSFGWASIFLVVPILLIPFYWRYRVPLALAILLFGGFATLYMLVLTGLDLFFGGTVYDSKPLLCFAIALAFAVLLFVIAMAFDIGDRERVTRRSDVAFWLHLGTAPALLYALFAVLLFNGTTALDWFEEPGLNEAIIAIVVVTIFMIIGILIDRRAFVTSGIISLGVAIAVVAKEAAIDMHTFQFLPLFAVGMVVLVFGIGWLRLRAILVSILPDSLTRLLPPVQPGGPA
jgi:hypothetical protein